MMRVAGRMLFLSFLLSYLASLLSFLFLSLSLSLSLSGGGGGGRLCILLSATVSLDGGFVKWQKGVREDAHDSIAVQVSETLDSFSVVAITTIHSIRRECRFLRKDGEVRGGGGRGVVAGSRQPMGLSLLCSEKVFRQRCFFGGGAELTIFGDGIFMANFVSKTQLQRSPPTLYITIPEP